MAIKAPDIDSRNATDIARQVQDLLAIYAPQWKEFDPATGNPEGMSAALIGIFARFCEIIIQRLNQVPEKNFLAFLELLGASLLPPQPARVPLTFTLAAGSTAAAVVPAGTQTAAPPAEGEKAPVIFETERELVLTPAQLASVFTRDPEQDLYADHSAIIASSVALGIPVFQGNRRIEHVFYLGHNRLLGFSHIKNVNLTVTLSSELEDPDPRELIWDRWDGADWVRVMPATDQTQNLTQSGSMTFGALQPIPNSRVHSINNRWLCCRLITSITQEAERKNGMVRDSQLPSLKTITLQLELDRDGLSVEYALTNLVPIDLNKEFYPFGEKPKFGDTFYLANSEAFSQADARVMLHVTLVNPVGSTGTSPPATRASEDIKLKWEFWNGEEWSEIGTSTLEGPLTPTSNHFEETTKALTCSGDVSFTLPKKPSVKALNGREHFWIRARLVSGNYGEEAKYVKDPTQPGGYRFEPATFAPPVISKISINYRVTTQNEAPEAVIGFNDFVYEDFTPVLSDPNKSFTPFKSAPEDRPTVYFGFTLPAEDMSFPNRTVSLFNRVADRAYGERSVPWSPDFSSKSGDPESMVIHTFVLTNPASQQETVNIDVLGTAWKATVTPQTITMDPGEAKEVRVSVTVPPVRYFPLGSSDRGFVKMVSASDPAVEYHAVFTTRSGAQDDSPKQVRLTWEYWNGRRWEDISVRDDSENVTRRGLVEFLPPKDFTKRKEFGAERYWLRALWKSGEYPYAPRLQRALLNTTLAAQTLSLENEILGSSVQSENQKFLTTRKPILTGQQLEVREPELPSADEQIIIKRDEGEDAIPDVAGRPKEIWVRWHEVPGFYGSGPRDRHYVVDHLSGEISFGNGLNGMIPPRGNGNIRMTLYKTGGGAAGNRPARAITQLKTTVPYVEKVANYEPATGGADAEILDSLFERAPRAVRHRNRSVTLEDYEDLAMLASPEVARARCMPLRNLAADPFGDVVMPGEVSVIIVPRTKDPKPLPSLELITRVQKHLIDHGIPTANVCVVGPLYIRVDVNVEIALISLEGASTVELAIRQELERFLHPLTGGLDGKGWDFGREPYKSDLYALIEPIPGVDHIPSLKLDDTREDPDGAIKKTGRFLVYSGNHRISLVFE